MNVLIIDDERHIVNYLAALIESQLDADLDLQKAYSAGEALNILASQKVDLLLLDIHMPGCTGLELAEKVAVSWPRCRIIFLTAYDNFEYAYQAGRFDRTSYLLKTESDETILKEIQKHINAHFLEIQTEMLASDAQNKSRFLNHLLCQNILKEILSGYNMNHLKSELKLVGSGFPLNLAAPVYLGYMTVHLRTIDEYSRNLSMLTMGYLCPAQELLQDSFSYAMLDLSHGNMLWFFQPSGKFSQALQPALAYLKGFAEDLTNYSLTALHRPADLILYPEAVSWENVPASHYQLLNSLELSGHPNTSAQSSVSVMEKRAVQTPVSAQNQAKADRRLQALSFYLYQNTPAEYEKTLEELHQQCRTLKSMHSLNALRIYLGISVTLLSYIELHQLQEKLASRTAVYPLYHLSDFSGWDEAFAYLKKLSACLFELLSRSTTDKNDAVIQKIKNYIRDHLSEPISLASLAAIVNYNETYISRLFRQNTGVKLSRYIFQERIEKAKFLLSTSSDSIQNIAAATGFDSQQYFSLVFKKSVGISPSEYQRIHS